MFELTVAYSFGTEGRDERGRFLSAIGSGVFERVAGEFRAERPLFGGRTRKREGRRSVVDLEHRLSGADMGDPQRTGAKYGVGERVRYLHGERVASGRHRCEVVGDGGASRFRGGNDPRAR